jgi:hypothetical protein
MHEGFAVAVGKTVAVREATTQKMTKSRIRKDDMTSLGIEAFPNMEVSGGNT